MKILGIGLIIAAVAMTGAVSLSVRQAGRSATVRLETKFPRPMYVGTPQDVRDVMSGKVRTGGRPPFLVPAGTTNVALGKSLTAGDDKPVVGDLQMITDGDKEGADGSCVELAPGLQHVTIDLERRHEIFAVLVWHYHRRPRAYFDVIVQTADDPDFVTSARTLFSNDIDNSAGLGVGGDRHYVETHRGKLIDAKGATARYIRLYSNGNSTDSGNHYIEVEVYGKPVRN